MQIDSNINSNELLQDLFNFEPIEKQLFGHIRPLLDSNISFVYKIDGKSKCFYSEFFRIIILEKKTLRLEIKFGFQDYRRIGTNDNKVNEFAVSLSYNTDITKRVMSMCKKINSMNSIYVKAKNLNDKFKKLKSLPIILDFLNSKIKTDKIECYSWAIDHLFHEIPGFSFYIRPIDKAPGDGMDFQFQDMKLKIGSRFNKEDEPLDQVFRRIEYPKGTEGMKQKIQDIENLQAALDSIDINECKELVEVQEFYNKGFEIYQELKAIH